MSEPQQSDTAWVSAESAQQMAADAARQAVAQALAEHQSASSAQGSISADQVHVIVQEALDRQAATHQEQLQQLMASMRGNVVTFIPEHAGGIGMDVAETWSQYDQHRAYLAAEAEREAATHAA
jgi:C4-dicarboxylate transporter